jgi:hypothetical protein
MPKGRGFTARVVSLVRVEGGALTLNGGVLRDNNAAGHGGGVYIAGGSFTMRGGAISGNTASGSGGGVYVFRGAFTKSGGAVYGSNAPEGQANKAPQGAAVYVDEGKRKRETTAQPSTALDTQKTGAAGGWE